MGLNSRMLHTIHDKAIEERFILILSFLSFFFSCLYKNFTLGNIKSVFSLDYVKKIKPYVYLKTSIPELIPELVNTNN